MIIWMKLANVLQPLMKLGFFSIIPSANTSRYSGWVKKGVNPPKKLNWENSSSKIMPMVADNAATCQRYLTDRRVSVRLIC